MKVQRTVSVTIGISLLGFSGLVCFSRLAAAEPEPAKPLIVKHGTIDLDLVETTPVVFGGR